MVPPPTNFFDVLNLSSKPKTVGLTTIAPLSVESIDINDATNRADLRAHENVLRVLDKTGVDDSAGGSYLLIDPDESTVGLTPTGPIAPNSSYTVLITLKDSNGDSSAAVAPVVLPLAWLANNGSIDPSTTNGLFSQAGNFTKGNMIGNELDDGATYESVAFYTDEDGKVQFDLAPAGGTDADLSLILVYPNGQTVSYDGLTFVTP